LNLREKFENEIGPADWKYLRPHFLRDAIIVVAHDLDLIDVGIKVAEDDAEQIQKWVNRGKLSKPTPLDAKEWERNKLELPSIIVSPFVLVQRKVKDNSN